MSPAYLPWLRQMVVESVQVDAPATRQPRTARRDQDAVVDYWVETLRKHTAGIMVDYHATLDDIAPWWLAFLRSPDEDEAEFLYGWISAWRYGPRDGQRHGVPGRVGALARVAGVPATEVRLRYEAGDIDIEGLMVLAGLRGWRMTGLELIPSFAPASDGQPVT